MSADIYGLCFPPLMLAGSPWLKKPFLEGTAHFCSSSRVFAATAPELGAGHRGRQVPGGPTQVFAHIGTLQELGHDEPPSQHEQRSFAPVFFSWFESFAPQLLGRRAQSSVRVRSRQKRGGTGRKQAATGSESNKMFHLRGNLVYLPYKNPEWYKEDKYYTINMHVLNPE